MMNMKNLDPVNSFADLPPDDYMYLPPESSPDVSTGILLSTLWNQSGVISIGSNTTVTYNEYTPIDPDTSKHSLTGCTNTAAAQIIYYFIENKGLKLSLTLSSGDAYTSNHSGTVINVKSDGSTPGTYSFSTINSYLVNYKLNSATHAAALIYACGVVQKAKYSSSATSTGWSTDLFYRAGFKSATFFYGTGKSTTYYWGTTDSSGNFTISDAGFEVLIENLQAGQPVGTSYPGHALVIDGYDGKNDTFHINFGWGKNTSSTRWYTRSEMIKKGYHEFVYDISLEYVETLTVTDGRVYGTGTMVRAFEQARSIKGSNTVMFSAAVAGASPELTEFIKVQDSTTIRDFNMSVTVTNARNWSWGAAFYADSDSITVFENFGGALIVNTGKSTNVAMYFYNGSRLSFSADNTLLYGGSYAVGGNYSTGAAKVLKAMRTARDNGGALDDFVLNNKSYSFYGTNGNDTIDLAGRSLVVGDIWLQSGDDTITVTGGSRLYGNINGSGNNTITIDSTSAIDGALYAQTNLNFVLNSAAQDHALFTVENSVYNIYSNATITVDIADAEIGSYILFAADDEASYADWLNRLSLTVTGSGQPDYKLVGNGTATSTCADLVYEERKLKLNVTLAPSDLLPKVLTVSADITSVTSHNVTVSATFNENVKTKQYSTDNKIWKTYTAGGVVMTANGVVYFRGIDAAGNISNVASYSVTNIYTVAATVVGKFTGAGGVFQMLSNGRGVISTVEASTTLTGSIDTSKWELAAVGDFNGDGKDGLIWVEKATGYAYMQFDMTTFAEINGKKRCLGVVGDGYSIKAGGDFSASGIDGVLMQGPAFGDPSISLNYGLPVWARDNTGATYNGWLGALVNTWEPGDHLKGDLTDPVSINANNYKYDIVGVGDFDGDGRDDVMLQNTMPKTVNGKTITGSGDVFTFLTGNEAAIKAGDPPTVCYAGCATDGWEVVGFGDFDGDGRDDALLSNGTGIAGWKMAAGQRVENFWFGNLPTGYAISGVADVDADGTDDIILVDAADQLSAWTVKNGGVTGAIALK